MQWMPSADDDLLLAIRAVELGARRARAALEDGRDLEVSEKGSPSEPVGRADRAAEKAIRDLIAIERPADAILAEEGGRSGSGEREWVIDPLDGTINYLRDLGGWGCSAALRRGQHTEASAIVLPGEEKLFYAAAEGGAFDGDGRALFVSGMRELERAVISTYLNPSRFADERRARQLTALVRSAATVRVGGVASLELTRVAAGKLDAWAVPDVPDWDWEAGALIVSEAGGALREVADWRIAAATDELADALAELIEAA